MLIIFNKNGFAEPIYDGIVKHVFDYIGILVHLLYWLRYLKHEIEYGEKDSICIFWPYHTSPNPLQE